MNQTYPIKNILNYDELMNELSALDTVVSTSLQAVSNNMLRLRIERKKIYVADSAICKIETPITLVEVCHVNYSDLGLQHKFTVMEDFSPWSEISIGNGGRFDYSTDEENQKRIQSLKVCFSPISMQSELDNFIKDLELKHNQFKELIEEMGSNYPAHY